jgi:hypothetical protein
LLIVIGVVIAFHPFRFDIAKYPFVRNAENLIARRNSWRQGNGA